MQHNVNVTAINNTIGVPPSSDGVMGIFVWAVAVGTTFLLNQAYLLTGMADLTALGIDAAYDVTHSTSVYQQVSEFYQQASDGALLWLIGVPVDTAYATYVAADLFDTLVRFTAADDPANFAKIWGFCYAPPSELQSDTDFPADVQAAITGIQTKQQALFLRGYRFSAIVDGYNMASDVAPSALATMTTNTAFAVSLCITGLQPNGVSGVGFALGRFARISIGHGFGAVEDGTMNTTAAYLTNSIKILPAGVLVVGSTYTVMGGAITYNAVVYKIGAQFTAIMGHTVFTTAAGGFVVENITPIAKVPGTQISGLSDTDIDQLGAKQFMFLRQWINKSGFYWNDAATCITTAKAFSSQEYNRVVNSLASSAMSTFIDNVNKNLPSERSTGNLAQGWILTTQQQFKEKYIDPLAEGSGTGDITDATLTIDGTGYSSTRKFKFAIKVLASTILGGVDGTIELVASL